MNDSVFPRSVILSLSEDYFPPASVARDLRARGSEV